MFLTPREYLRSTPDKLEELESAGWAPCMDELGRILVDRFNGGHSEAIVVWRPLRDDRRPTECE